MNSVAVTTGIKTLDARAIRADFPIFEQLIHGKPLAFLDSAASSQKPRQMMEAMTDFYSTSYANVHRGVYVLAERATAALESSREKVRALLNAPDVREIIFVRNATEAVNLVAYAWGMSNLGQGDVVVVSELEHHSNFVPWQYIAGRTGAELAMIPLTEEGELDLSALDGIAPSHLEPADVSRRAISGEDPIAVEAVEIFCALLGTVAGNLALTAGARGGVSSYVQGPAIPLRSGHALP